MKAKLLKVDWYDPELTFITEAAGVLERGGLVAFPTETVYGLGADGLNSKAVISIFNAKGRPVDNPLILHVSEPSEVYKIAYPTPLAEKLMKSFWPGPLTLVLRAKDIVPPEATGGLDTVAVRMPSNQVANQLIRYAGVPVAGPSANRSGRPSPTDAEAVFKDLGDFVDIILDAGPTHVGVESTVLDVTGDKAVLLRPGGQSVEAISEVAGAVDLIGTTDQKKMSPGTRYRHYAPLVPLFLTGEGEPDPAPFLKRFSRIGYLGISDPEIDVTFRVIFTDIRSYARGLFSAMRELESKNVDAIVAEFPSEKGIGLALRDRLRRASGR